MSPIKITEKENSILQLLSYMYHNISVLTQDKITNHAAKLNVSPNIVTYIIKKSGLLTYNKPGGIDTYKWNPCLNSEKYVPIIPNIHMVRAIIKNYRHINIVAENNNKEIRKIVGDNVNRGKHASSYLKVEKFLTYIVMNATDWTDAKKLGLSRVRTEIGIPDTTLTLLFYTDILQQRSSGKPQYRLNPCVGKITPELINYVIEQRRVYSFDRTNVEAWNFDLTDTSRPDIKQPVERIEVLPSASKKKNTINNGSDRIITPVDTLNFKILAYMSCINQSAKGWVPRMRFDPEKKCEQMGLPNIVYMSLLDYGVIEIRESRKEDHLSKYRWNPEMMLDNALIQNVMPIISKKLTALANITPVIENKIEPVIETKPEPERIISKGDNIKRAHSNWTDSEVQLLIDSINKNVTINDIANLLGRKFKQVECKVYRMGGLKSIKKMPANAEKPVAVEEQPNEIKPERVIIKKAVVRPEKIKKQTRKCFKWTEDEIWILINGVKENMGTREIADMLNRDMSQVYNKISYMGGLEEVKKIVLVGDYVVKPEVQVEHVQPAQIRAEQVEAKVEHVETPFETMNTSESKPEPKKPGLFKRIYRAILDK